MSKTIKKIIGVMLVTLCFANNVLAATVQKMYNINANSIDTVTSGLLSIYNNNVESDGKNYVYLYDNEDRYFLSYLEPLNSNLFRYYYLSNVSNQKNTEFLNWLGKFNYSAKEVLSDAYINQYQKKIFSNKKLYSGKIAAIAEGTLGEFNAQKLFANSYQQPLPQQSVQQIQQTPPPSQTQQAQQTNTQKTIPAGYTMNLLAPVAVAVCSTTTTKTYTTILTRDIVVDGDLVVPRGSKVEGTLRPNIYRDYNRNHFDISFNKIKTPDGKVIPIRTEQRSIYETQKTQYEFTAENLTQTSSSNSGSSSSTGGGLSTGAVIVAGAVAVGLAAIIAGAIFGGSDSDSSSSSSSGSSSSSSSTKTETSTNTTYQPLYYSQTPAELCSNNNIGIEKNALIDIIITAPVLVY